MFKKVLFIFAIGLVCFSTAQAQVSRAIQQRRSGSTTSQNVQRTPQNAGQAARTEDVIMTQNTASATETTTEAPRGPYMGITPDSPPPRAFYKDQLKMMLRFGATFDKPYLELIEKDPSKSKALYEEALSKVKWPSSEVTEKQLITFYQGTFREIEAQTGIPMQVMNEEMKNEESEEDRVKRLELQERYQKLFGRGEPIYTEDPS